MSKRQYFFVRHPVFTMVLLLVVIFIMLDGLLGFLLIRPDYQGFRTRHYYYHHGLRKNQSAFARWNTEIYPFYTNNFGLRDVEKRKISSAVADKRLLIIGDSHTEGVDLPFEETFAGILAKKGKSANLDVLNAAVISYSPKIYYLKLRYLLEVEKLKVDDVFCLIDISDIQNELVYEKYEPQHHGTFHRAMTAIQGFLKRHSFTVYALNKILTDRQMRKFYTNIESFSAAGEMVNRFNTSSAELYYSFFSHFNDKVLLSNPRFHGVGEWLYDDYFKTIAEKGIQLGQQNIREMKELCDAYNIHLTIAVHPWYSQIYRRDPEDAYVKSWKSFAENEGIDFVNLFPLFINEENPEIAFKKYYLQGDNHWNAAGHARVADYLASVLKLKPGMP